MYKFVATLSLPFIIFFFFAAEQNLSSLTINLISINLQNGAGKEVDIQIVKEELERLGHEIRLCDLKKNTHAAIADINIFFAQFSPVLFSKAKLNWFIPNPEFCEASLNELKQFNMVLCKTQECFRIFQPIAKNVFYLGFTSRDCYRHLEIKKNFKSYLHLAGRSVFKGTNAVCNAWQSNPSLPYLVIIKDGEIKNNFSDNVKRIQQHIPGDLLLKYQNECGVHVCPSKTEGYGHYIAEGMSARSVIITTDAPPMNEFITDKRCLVKYHKTKKHRYATVYEVNSKDLTETVKQLQALPTKELRMIGKKNRKEYLRRQQEFKNNIEKLMSMTVQSLAEACTEET